MSLEGELPGRQMLTNSRASAVVLKQKSGLNLLI